VERYNVGTIVVVVVVVVGVVGVRPIASGG
jgi:hypothetical protein